MTARHPSVRAVLAFLVLLGVVAYALPIALAPAEVDVRWWSWMGGLLVVLGSASLLWCAWSFFATGRGTLAPWDPPKDLVRVGLYRHSLNPMYVSVVVVVARWAVAYRSAALGAYALAVAVAFHLRVRLYEEPRLQSAFGKEWQEYRSQVRRWL